MTETMIDATKARELIDEIYPGTSLGDYGLKETLVLKSMEWKTLQIIEWLKSHINDYIVWGRDIDYIFDDLEKEMKK